MPSVNDVIVHCQKQIKKNPPEEKLLHYLNRLDRLRVTVQDLMNTGVGRTVNQLSRHDADVGKFASRLVKKWKAMVSDDNSEDSQSSSSSAESEDDNNDKRGSDRDEDSNLANRYQAVNGHGSHHKKLQRNEEEFGEFNNNNEDSDDDDRLCIADEDGAKSEQKSPVFDIPAIKQEKIIPSTSEESDAEDFTQAINTQPIQPRTTELRQDVPEATFNPLNNVKSERLSESEQSSGDEHLTCPVNHDREEEQQNGDNHRDKKYHNDSSHSKKKKDHKEKSSHKHQRHEKEKHKKDKRHRSEDKESKKDSHKVIKIKEEPKDSDSNDDGTTSKHQSNNKRDQEEKRSSSEKHKSKQKDKDRHHKSKDKDKKRVESYKSEDKDSKRKCEEENGDLRSSPDRKKIKLVDDRPLKKKPSIHIDSEINSESGVKFEELLGCLDKNLSSKSKHKEKSKKSSKNKEKDEVTKLTRRNDLKKTEEHKRNKQLESIIAPTVNISPNYKPPAAIMSRTLTPPKPPSIRINVLETCDPGNYWEDQRITHTYAKEVSSEEALTSMFKPSKSQRTKVFSGRTVGYKGAVPKLFDLCMQVIQENIGDLGYTGGVPYDILKPALERASVQQLLQIEEFNPYLIGSTDDLWKFHCSKEFRGRKPEGEDMETWRELYERCISERNEKFAIVRKKMLQKVEVAEPVRKAKLAYVEPVGGPRFNRSKAATIKNGMRSLKIKEEKGPRKGVGSSASAGFNNPTDSSKIITEHAVLINPESRAAHASSSRSGGGESRASSKPRKAPLMAKTMKFIKTLKRR